MVILDYTGDDQAFLIQIIELNRRCKLFEKSFKTQNTRLQLTLYIGSFESINSVYTQTEPHRAQWIKDNSSHFFDLLHELQKARDGIAGTKILDADDGLNKLRQEFLTQKKIHEGLLRTLKIMLQPKPETIPQQPKPSAPISTPVVPPTKGILEKYSPCCTIV